MAEGEATIREIYIEAFSGTGTDIIKSIIVSLSESIGVPLPNLLGATASFKAKKKYSVATPILDLDETDGITIDDVAGTLTIVITKDHFSTLFNPAIAAEQLLVYDLDLIDNTGQTYRLFKGDLTVGGDL